VGDDSCFDKVLLSGPTYFSEVIGMAEAVATSQPFNQDDQNYSVLLIITDGVINDMKRTIQAVCSASDKPLSIIIVGVGDADFGDMKTLDGDDAALEFNGTQCARDIVQFIPYRDFSDKHISRLAAATLEEIPTQVLSFARVQNVVPGRIKGKGGAPILKHASSHRQMSFYHKRELKEEEQRAESKDDEPIQQYESLPYPESSPTNENGPVLQFQISPTNKPVLNYQTSPTNKNTPVLQYQTSTGYLNNPIPKDAPPEYTD